MNIEHVSGFKYRIPKVGKMRVDATFYASEGILEDLRSEDYASLRQICNVATLPGVVEPALTMPDIHWGYGFPIGGVAAFDPNDGGVVSPGGVGFDINCGVRLLVSELSRKDIDPIGGRLVADPQKTVWPTRSTRAYRPGWAGAARTLVLAGKTSRRFWSRGPAHSSDADTGSRRISRTSSRKDSCPVLIRKEFPTGLTSAASPSSER